MNLKSKKSIIILSVLLTVAVALSVVVLYSSTLTTRLLVFLLTSASRLPTPILVSLLMHKPMTMVYKTTRK